MSQQGREEEEGEEEDSSGMNERRWKTEAAIGRLKTRRRQIEPGKAACVRVAFNIPFHLFLTTERSEVINSSDGFARQRLIN